MFNMYAEPGAPQHAEGGYQQSGNMDFTTPSFGDQHNHQDHGLMYSGLDGVGHEYALKSPSAAPRGLAGEPAYCAGRHCCHWSVNGIACNNHYPSAEDLDHHVANDHAGKLWNGQASGEYHCHWTGCSKTDSFGNKPKLTRHIHSHTGHKPHQCPYPDCGKAFVTKEQLKNHETTHTRTKQHVCPECGKAFAVKTALTSHMNVHNGTKPYVCDECGKGFADSSNLSKHKAIHRRSPHKKTSRVRRQHHTHTHNHTHATPVDSPFQLGTMASFSTGYAGASAADIPTQSIERSLQELYARPCFDTQCPDANRLPCRSVSPCMSAPCSTRGCSPHCVQPCDLDDCSIPACHGDIICDGDECFEDCSLADCGLGDCDAHQCFTDCHLCDGLDLDCFCNMDASALAAGEVSTPSTNQSIPQQPTQGFPDPFPASQQQHYDFSASQTWPDFQARPAQMNAVPAFDGMDAGIADGFKQLHDYIHSDFNNYTGG